MNDRPKNWVELAVYIENTLGVDLLDHVKPGTKAFRAKQQAAGVLKKTAEKRGASVDDVVAATNWMAHNGKKAKHYCAPFYFLEHEVDTSNVEGDQDDDRLAKALAAEQTAATAGDAEANRWFLRLSRTRGAALVEALAAWERDRG